MISVASIGAEGKMSTRGLYILKHDSELGNGPAFKLFERFSDGMKVDVPRGFADCEIRIDKFDIPASVNLMHRA